MAEHASLDVVDNNVKHLFQYGGKEDYLKLYNKYAPAVLGVLTRTLGDQQLAEKCIHETFCRVWAERNNYDPNKERVFTFVLKIARECAAKWPMDEKINLYDEIREEIDLVYATDISTYLQEKKLADGDNFACTVDETIRAAIGLIYFKAYSFSAAAAELGLSVDTLREKMIKAIKQLKGSLLA
jgi:RNA polymerase sigma factor (sigma-70 family)